MNKFSIKLNLTTSQWGLLIMAIKYVTPLLPQISWGDLEEVENIIEEQLKSARIENYIEEQFKEENS